VQYTSCAALTHTLRPFMIRLKCVRVCLCHKSKRDLLYECVCVQCSLAGYRGYSLSFSPFLSVYLSLSVFLSFPISEKGRRRSNRYSKKEANEKLPDRSQRHLRLERSNDFYFAASLSSPPSSSSSSSGRRQINKTQCKSKSKL